MPDIIFKLESFAIIGAAIEVHRTLGNGFLEAVYQEALAVEFTKQNIPFEQEKKLRIRYKDVYLEKYYYADFVCYDKIIVESKAIGNLLPEHDAQVLNYLNITDFRLGILINFGKTKLEFERLVK